MWKMRVGVGICLLVALFSSFSIASETPAILRLLNSYTDYEEHWANAIIDIRRANIEPAIMVRQPLHQNFVVVLVVDPGQAGRRWVEIELFEGEGAEGDKGKSNKSGESLKWKVEEITAYPNAPSEHTGVFIGKAPIYGTHSTPVKAKYVVTGPKDKEERIVESNLVYMAFH